MQFTKPYPIIPNCALTLVLFFALSPYRHSREGGKPGVQVVMRSFWIPASARMTVKTKKNRKHGHISFETQCSGWSPGKKISKNMAIF